MGIHRTKHRTGSEPYEPYVRLDYVMISSAAWKILTPDARQIYPHILAQWKAGNGLTRLSLPASHVEWMMRREHRAAADRDLVEKGFLDVIKLAGRLTPAVYSVSERWRKISQDLIKDSTQGRVIFFKSPTKSEPGLSQWEPSRRSKNPTQRECGMKGKTTPEKYPSPSNSYKVPTQGGQAKGGSLTTQGGQAGLLLDHTGGTKLDHTGGASKRKSEREEA